MIKSPCVLFWQAEDSENYILSASEKAQVARFTSIKRQREFAQGRTLLRRAFAALDQPVPESVAVEPNGKPYVTSGPSFNLSHSQGAVALYVDSGPVGLDIEQRQQSRDFQSIAQQFGTKEEVRYLKSLPESERAEVFYKIWSLKEAYAKATGDGIGQATLNQVQFNLDAGLVTHLPTGKIAQFYLAAYEDWRIGCCRMGSIRKVPTFYRAFESHQGFQFEELKNVQFEKFVFVVPGVAAND